MLRTFGWVVVAALLCAGCSGGESTNSTASPSAPDAPSADGKGEQAAPSSAEAGAAATDANGKGPAQEAADARTDTMGRWLVVITDAREATGFPALLIEVERGENDAFQVKLLEAQYLPGTPKLKSAEADAEKMHLVLDMEGQRPLDIRAHFAEGRIRGSVVFSTMGCEPIFYLPTELDSIKALQPVELAGREDLSRAVQSSNELEDLKKFCEKFTNSPLALAGYARQLVIAKSNKLDAAAVEALKAEFLENARKWGPRMQLKARLDYAMILANNKYFPEMALAELDALEKDLSDETAERWKIVIDTERQVAQKNLAIVTLSSGTGEQKQQAYEKLKEIQKENAFDHELLFALAQYDEAEKRIDDAIGRYARLAVWPLAEMIFQQTWQQEEVDHPLPSETVARLWKEKHGSTDGLDAYLDDSYHQLMATFTDEKVPPRGPDGGNRTALIEFFTGVECPPCVGAVVAVHRLQKMYPPNDVLVLSYEQHIPHPNPLVNADSESRLAFYQPDPQQRGAPMAFINGKELEGLGGVLLSQADGILSRLREPVDAQLKEKTDIRISLDARAANGAINIVAQVEGLANSAQTTRLRLALAQEDVQFVGGNGIRHHSMVVRAMPGGMLGVGPNDRRITYKKTVQLADIQQQLKDYLAEFEQKNEQEFRIKPLEMDKLHLVAFVQDDSTKEILQAASIPVAGDLTIEKKADAAQAAPQGSDVSVGDASQTESQGNGVPREVSAN